MAGASKGADPCTASATASAGAPAASAAAVIPAPVSGASALGAVGRPGSGASSSSAGQQAAPLAAPPGAQQAVPASERSHGHWQPSAVASCWLICWQGQCSVTRKLSYSPMPRIMHHVIESSHRVPKSRHTSALRTVLSHDDVSCQDHTSWTHFK